MISMGRPIGTASDLRAYQKALDVIGDFADRICADIPMVGSEENLELSGKGKADVNLLIKNLANIGIEGAGKYQKTKYQGLLHEDLAEVLNNSINCKRDIFIKLKDLLLNTNEKTRNP
jgi:TRAP-type uncharacterized transport system substrate-binding protein